MRSCVLLVVAFTFGCTNQEAKPKVAASAPVLPAPMPSAQAEALTGRVLETKEASTYTYLRLSTSSGEKWAAIPTTAVVVGAEVTLVNPVPMENFVSKTLDRTFPLIYFSSGIREQSAPAVPVAAPAAADPSLDKLTAWAEQAEPVAKATGANAKTVAEIYGQRTALNDKPVQLRGKVVKVTSGVLGKTWLHLRDGTGTAEGKDNDLTVTTSDTAAMGEVITVSGPVHLQRDFGSGYVFPVMIEDAKIVR